MFFYRGEQAKKQDQERLEAQAVQQAAMTAIEAESKKVCWLIPLFIIGIKCSGGFTQLPPVLLPYWP